MADQSTTVQSTTYNDNLLMSFFSRKALKVLKAKCPLYAIVDKEVVPLNSGINITFSGWRPLGGASSTLSQWPTSANSAVALSSRRVAATLVKRGRWIKMDERSIQTSIIPVDVGAVEALIQSAKLTLEDVIQTAAFSGLIGHVGARARTTILSAWMSSHTSGFCSNTRADHAAGSGATTSTFGFPVLFGTSATRLSAICTSAATLSARIGPVGLRKCLTRLQRLNVDPLDGGSYVAYMHPYAHQALLANPLYEKFILSYAEGPRESVFPGEMKHAFMGMRAVVSNNAPYYRKAAAASGLSANLTLIIGKGALTCAELEGNSVAIILKRPSNSSTNDPFSVLHTASFKLDMVAAVTNPSAGVILISVDPSDVTG